MIILTDAEKPFNTIQHFFMIKDFDKVVIQGTHFNIIKTIDDKPTERITLTEEKLKGII